MDELASDLVLYTAALAVLIFWIGLFVLIGIEIWDEFHEEDPEEED